MVDFVAGQRDQSGGWAVSDAFGGGEDGEVGVGEHGQDGPALPGDPAVDLVVIESGQLSVRCGPAAVVTWWLQATAST